MLWISKRMVYDLSILRTKGFTLLELLIVLAILAILTTIAVPSFNDSSSRRASESLQGSLLSSLRFARGEAVAKRDFVSICSFSNNTTCGTATDWENGWLVFTDKNRDGSYNSAAASEEKLLRVYEYTGRGVLTAQNAGASGAGTAAISSLTFDIGGNLTDLNNASNIKGFFNICLDNNEAKYARAVFVEPSGRIVPSRDKDGDLIHEKLLLDDNGNLVIGSLTCGAT